MGFSCLARTEGHFGEQEPRDTKAKKPVQPSATFLPSAKLEEMEEKMLD